MPTNSQHAKRVKDGMRFIAFIESGSNQFDNELVTAYFYTALHMIEATLYDFPYRSKRDFLNHGDRNSFLSDVAFDTKSPFCGMSDLYKALQGLSEQGRYLSPAGTSNYTPLLPQDVPQAKEAYLEIKRRMEAAYASAGKTAPWL